MHRDIGKVSFIDGGETLDSRMGEHGTGGGVLSLPSTSDNWSNASMKVNPSLNSLRNPIVGNIISWAQRACHTFARVSKLTYVNHMVNGKVVIPPGTTEMGKTR